MCSRFAAHLHGAQREEPRVTTQADAPKSAPRLELDGAALRHAVTALLVGLALAGILAGWNGLAWAGALAGMPGLLRHLAPLIVDGALVVMTLSAVARRSHGHTARWMWATVAALVTGSSATQVAHALETTTATTSIQLGVALTVGALPPVIVLVATHAWLDLAVASAPTKARKAKSAAPTSKPAATEAPTAPAKVRQERPRAQPKTAVDIDAVRALTAQGLSQRAIAAKLGTSKSSVARAQELTEAA